MAPASIVEFSARNERWIVLVGLGLVSATGLILTMRIGDGLMMSTMLGETSPTYPVLLFLMWWTMMMAMMLPSAAPAILTFGAISQKFAKKGAPAAPLAVFVTGYVAIWTSFAAAALTLQLLLNQTIALSMMMAVTSAVVGGGLLVAAGLYQMSPPSSSIVQLSGSTGAAALMRQQQS